MRDNWTIEYAERRLKLGIFDDLIFGRDAGHSYLRLLNGEGKIVSELHGRFHDTMSSHIKNTSKDMTGRLMNELRGIFKGAVSNTPYEPVWLKVYEKTENFICDKDTRAQTLSNGSETHIRAKWECARAKADSINQTGLDYKAIDLGPVWHARNCHTVSASLIRAMGLDLPPKSFFARPGFEPTRLNEPTHSDTLILNRLFERAIAPWLPAPASNFQPVAPIPARA